MTVDRNLFSTLVVADPPATIDPNERTSGFTVRNRIAFLDDPEGHPFELIQYLRAGAREGATQ